MLFTFIFSHRLLKPCSLYFGVDFSLFTDGIGYFPLLLILLAHGITFHTWSSYLAHNIHPPFFFSCLLSLLPVVLFLLLYHICPCIFNVFEHMYLNLGFIWVEWCHVCLFLHPSHSLALSLSPCYLFPLSTPPFYSDIMCILKSRFHVWEKRGYWYIFLSLAYWLNMMISTLLLSQQMALFLSSI